MGLSPLKHEDARSEGSGGDEADTFIIDSSNK